MIELYVLNIYCNLSYVVLCLSKHNHWVKDIFPCCHGPKLLGSSLALGTSFYFIFSFVLPQVETFDLYVIYGLQPYHYFSLTLTQGMQTIYNINDWMITFNIKYTDNRYISDTFILTPSVLLGLLSCGFTY